MSDGIIGVNRGGMSANYGRHPDPRLFYRLQLRTTDANGNNVRTILPGTPEFEAEQHNAWAQAHQADLQREALLNEMMRQINKRHPDDQPLEYWVSDEMASAMRRHLPGYKDA